MLLDCYGDMDGTGAFYALGGTMNYTFSEVSNTAGATLAAAGISSQSIFAAGAGEVTFRVTDAHGCEAVATITFTQPDTLIPGTIGVDQVICFEDDPNPITELTPASGGPAGGYSYQWQMSFAPGGPYMNIPGETGLDYDPPAGTGVNHLLPEGSTLRRLCARIYGYHRGGGESPAFGPADRWRDHLSGRSDPS